MRVLNLPLLLWVMLHPVVVEAATFAVDTTSDNDTLTACTAAPGDCSFRGAALRAQNAALAPGDDLIQ
ncbi:MAG: hypothetical protein KDI56_16040, partial [Xanthomonadales bacterium]|nr:hypothetical protein [Xanthomonadales bacterium]